MFFFLNIIRGWNWKLRLVSAIGLEKWNEFGNRLSMNEKERPPPPITERSKATKTLREMVDLVQCHWLRTPQATGRPANERRWNARFFFHASVADDAAAAAVDIVDETTSNEKRKKESKKERKKERERERGRVNSRDEFTNSIGGFTEEPRRVARSAASLIDRYQCGGKKKIW